MTIDTIIEYVLKTPLNTNKAILREMLEQLIKDNSSGGVSGGTPEGGAGSNNYLPEPGTVVIFDGSYV